MRAQAADLPIEDDDGLVVAARSDPEAFGLIYQRYRGPVYRFLRATGTDDPTAGDLTAITFERALRSIGSYRPDGPGLRAWLFRIARNAAIDRHRAIRPSARLDAVPPDLLHGPDEQASVELRILVAQLPHEARESIDLRYAARLTARESGAIVGRSPDAVQKTITRALAALRQEMQS